MVLLRSCLSGARARPFKPSSLDVPLRKVEAPVSNLDDVDDSNSEMPEGRAPIGVSKGV